MPWPDARHWNIWPFQVFWNDPLFGKSRHMTMLAMAGLTPLYDACRQGQAQYAEAAGAVNDPGLKLQFSRMAAARATILCEIASVFGLEAEPGADMHQEQASPVSPLKRAPLGGEVRCSVMSGSDLRRLVRALREQDEHVLTQMRQHVDAVPCIATTEVLERAIVLLSHDLEKIRILEGLTAGEAGDAGP